MLDPDVLLFDEPFGALDPITRSHLQREIRALIARLQKTVLLVTHDLVEAAFLGDEIALLRDGRLVQKGTIRDLVDAPAEPFVSEFIAAQRPLLSLDASARPKGSDADQDASARPKGSDANREDPAS
jgi:osmoprotectant transport system ATP-binding protein